MDFDNDRDRFQHGYDAGVIIDGRVVFDSSIDEYVIVDDDGIALSVQQILKTAVDRNVRLTFIPLESIQKIENLLASSGD